MEKLLRKNQLFLQMVKRVSLVTTEVASILKDSPCDEICCYPVIKIGASDLFYILFKIE